MNLAAWPEVCNEIFVWLDPAVCNCFHSLPMLHALLEDQNAEESQYQLMKS